MTASNENLDSLKLKLSSALKNKLLKDNEGLSLRNREFLYSEELLVVKTEINFVVEQLKNLKSQIHFARHQISLVDICATSEKSKIDTHVTDLTRHKEQFDDIFKKVNHLSELRKRELEQNEEDLKNFKKQKEKQAVEKMEILQRETIAVEKECESIERECVVLAKRNNAIMLKLRRKLVETENIRKELMTKNISK